MTPQEKTDRYRKVHALIWQVERCLRSGMSGDRVARAVHDLFEEIPNPLRDILARAGAGEAMSRLQKAEGPIADIVDGMYRNCKADPNYKRRLAEFWECLGDAQCSGIEEGEDSDHVPGELDDENAAPVRVGGTRGAAPSRDGGQVAEAPDVAQAGGPTSEFVFPGQEETQEPAAAEQAAIEDEGEGRYDEETEDDGGGGI